MKNQRQELEEFIASLTKFPDHIRKNPYEKQTPTEIYAALIDIGKNTDSLINVLKKVGAMPHQGPRTTPRLNWPLGRALLNVHLETHLKRVRRGESSSTLFTVEYPQNVLLELYELREFAKIAADRLKPKKGNSNSRKPDSSMKEMLATNVVRKYFELYGSMPPTTKTGWLANALSDLFEKTNLLPPNGDYWLRRGVAIMTRNGLGAPSAPNPKKK